MYHPGDQAEIEARFAGSGLGGIWTWLSPEERYELFAYLESMAVFEALDWWREQDDLNSV